MTVPPRASIATTEGQHGGNLSWAMTAFGGSADQWLDLSTGINPHGYPVPEMPATVWQRLPDSAAFTQAEDAARKIFGVPSAKAVVVTAGTQAAINVLPRMRPHSRVAVVGKTYSEHALAWAQAGHEVREAESLTDACSADVVVVVNPNNPDGRVYPRDELCDAARALSARDGTLIVDEAFADCCPDESLAQDGQYANIVILRSVGKFYGLAGIRVGFVICPSALALPLRQLLGPWSVTGPSLAACTVALNDAAWRDDTRRRLLDAGRRLEQTLVAADLTLIGRTDLFALTTTPRAQALWKFLARQHILVRRFEQQPLWLRFGLPGSEAGWQRLHEAFASFAEVTA